ncbi:high frequency lysogenization protein HflD [Lonepinella sp. BR2919]|uniref:high frequency lysogenization protein HflD n=1 Tax=unclassified Lonepinella TaxID=2642006 RepID=UPI003F6DE2AC
MANYQDITLALAGVCQSARLVQQFAQRGQANNYALEVSLKSLLQTHPTDTLAVFGGSLDNIKLGLETLIEQLNAQNPELARYWLSLVAMAGRLQDNAEAKSQLAHRIQYMPTQLEYYSLLDETMLEKIATIYTDILSPLGKRIQIFGNAEYLQQPSIQNRIRACLLAGVRSAMLWQQVGGSKWQLLFSRRKILNMAQQLYETI